MTSDVGAGRASAHILKFLPAGGCWANPHRCRVFPTVPTRNPGWFSTAGRQPRQTAGVGTARKTSASADDTFPRLRARTQRFTLGEPRTLTLCADGSRVLFLRSAAGD